MIVLPDDHVVVRRRRQDWQQIVRIGRSACDQCSFCTELCPRWLLGHPIEPHRAMRSLEFNLVGEANAIGTAFCCECNLCSLYSCPEDLDPKNVCTQNKRRLAAEKKRWENPPFNPRRAELHLENRKAPMPRLIQKLGLGQFRNVGPLQPGIVPAKRVGIALKQHIGEPCEAVVKPGQAVKRGQVVGRPPTRNGKPALGVPVHASIDGPVTRRARRHRLDRDELSLPAIMRPAALLPRNALRNPIDGHIRPDVLTLTLVPAASNHLGFHPPCPCPAPSAPSSSPASASATRRKTRCSRPPPSNC